MSPGCRHVCRYHLTNTVRRLFAEFRAAERGNIVITFALAIIPVIGGVGAAVDYSRANSAKTGLQAAIDAAGLILSKEAQTLTQAQLTSKADALVRANFNYPEATDLAVTPIFTTIDSGSYKLNLAATAKVPTTFTAMWQPTMTIGADAEVLWGMKRLELVLALDNTGSMSSSNKMTQLKARLERPAEDLAERSEEAGRHQGRRSCRSRPTSMSARATRTRPGSDGTNGRKRTAPAASLSKKTKTACENSNGNWTPASKNNWNGCVWDRDQNNDTNNTAPSHRHQGDALFREPGRQLSDRNDDAHQQLDHSSTARSTR